MRASSFASSYFRFANFSKEINLKVYVMIRFQLCANTNVTLALNGFYSQLLLSVILSE